MAHHTLRSGFTSLAERLNRFPRGAPPSERLFAILKLLFSEREAGLVAQLPIRPFTARRAAAVWRLPPAEAQRTLETLAGRGILVDVEDRHGVSWYTLPPPMAGFFEFSMMRVRRDVDQKVLAELFWQYLNVEEDFIRDLFGRGTTQLGRAFVHEPALSEDNALHVLDHERATAVVETASCVGVGLCYCRHKMGHLGRACDAPLDICMTFNATAQSLTRHGIARKVDAVEGKELLAQAWERGLVQFGENVQRRVNFICNCCGCCCEAMLAARRFAFLHPVHTTNFLPEVRPDACNGCGKCAAACPVEAMTLVSAHDPRRRMKKAARLDEERCLGCGVCVPACPTGALALKSRPQRVLTPLDGTHRVLLMAIERGTLQHLVFDQRVLWSHRALAAVLGGLLRLPPVKRAMASEQFRSRYLETLVRRLRS